VSQLEELLQQWKKDLRTLEGLRPLDVEELEQHVRDSAADLTTKGLSNEEAFLIATRRLGEHYALGREFGKVNGSHIWTRRAFWMLAGYLLMQICEMFVSGVVSLGQVFAVMLGGDGTVLACVSIGLTVAFWGGVILGFCRWAHAGHDGGTFVQFFRRSSTPRVVFAFMAIIAVAGLIKVGSQVALARLTSVETYGEAALISAWANAAFAFLVPLAFIVLMLSMRRQMQTS
jgi:hypothetical protein